jgi:hypothetical protein
MMAFRRQRDDWDKFVREHMDELLFCGIPREVFSNKRRFLLFLDHGFDQWAWAKNRHARVFNARDLTDAQVRRLSRLVGDHIDQECGRIIGDVWMRQR